MKSVNRSFLPFIQKFWWAPIKLYIESMFLLFIWLSDLIKQSFKLRALGNEQLIIAVLVSPDPKFGPIRCKMRIQISFNHRSSFNLLLSFFRIFVHLFLLQFDLLKKSCLLDFFIRLILIPVVVIMRYFYLFGIYEQAVAINHRFAIDFMVGDRWNLIWIVCFTFLN